MKLDTKLVQFDSAPDDPFRPNAAPLYQTATFAQESAEGGGRYDYTRSGNPTRTVLEAQLARLEGAERAFAFASGMAALSAVTRLARPGERVVAGLDLYGGTYRLLEDVASRGVEVEYVDTGRADAVADALVVGARLLLVETPTNPMLRIADLRALAGACRERGVLLCVDGTAMSPYLQRPLEIGADLVVHSATKHLAGHSDVTAGVVCSSHPDAVRELAFVQNAEGTALAPFEAWLCLRGLETLGVRLEREQRTARVVARFLAGRPEVTSVHYPGLASHPGFELHATQASGTGSLLSFETGSRERSKRVVEALELFSISVSFGSVKSLASLPCAMSHASIPGPVRRARSLPEDLVRLSIGLEDPDDLIEDLRRALRRAGKAIGATS